MVFEPVMKPRFRPRPGPADCEGELSMTDCTTRGVHVSPLVNDEGGWR